MRTLHASLVACAVVLATAAEHSFSRLGAAAPSVERVPASNDVEQPCLLSYHPASDTITCYTIDCPSCCQQTSVTNPFSGTVYRFCRCPEGNTYIESCEGEVAGEGSSAQLGCDNTTCSGTCDIVMDGDEYYCACN